MLFAPLSLLWKILWLARLLRDSPWLTTAGSPPFCQASGSIISCYCQPNLMVLASECVLLEVCSGWFRKILHYTLWLTMRISGCLTRTKKRWIILFNKEVETLLFLKRFFEDSLFLFSDLWLLSLILKFVLQFLFYNPYALFCFFAEFYEFF